MQPTAVNPDETKRATFRLNCLVEQIDGMFVGWCIETGIVASGLTIRECAITLIHLNCEHIAFALDNENSSDIFHSAPEDVMNRFLLIAKQTEPSKDEPGVCTEAPHHPLFSVHPAIYATASIPV